MGRQKFGFDACIRTGTVVCKREAALQEAEGRLEGERPALSALFLWDAVQSQWRVGMNGATGLDYVAVFLVADKLGLEVSSDVFRFLQTLEVAQLSEWNQAAEKTRARAEANAGHSRGHRGR